MKVNIRRIYVTPQKSEGTRVLVDRLWPRGVSRERARLSLWAKEAAPSNELRKWFHEDPGKRLKKFHADYRKELRGNASAIKSLLSGLKRPITLVTAVSDRKHSHIPVLVEFLRKVK